MSSDKALKPQGNQENPLSEGTPAWAEVESYKIKYTNNQQNPYLGYNWKFFRIFFSWVDPIIHVAAQAEFTQKLHYNLCPEDTSEAVSALFEANWKSIYPDSQITPGTPTPIYGFFLTIYRTFKTSVILALVLQVVSLANEFGTAYLIFLGIEQVALVNYKLPLAASADALVQLCWYMLIFLVLRVLGSLSENYINFVNSVAGLKLKHAINGLILKKVMKKSFERDTTFDVGEMTNLTQVDAARFAEIGNSVGYIISLPVKIFFGVIALFFMMGFAMIPTLGVLIVFMIVNTGVAKMHEKYKASYMIMSDLRGKLVGEIIGNIKFIKIAALENVYLVKLAKIRLQELHWVFMQQFRYSMSNTLIVFGTGIFMLTLYVSKLKRTNQLTLTEAILSQIVFGIFGHCLRNIGILGVFVMDCIISARRICFFLLSEEIDTRHFRLTAPVQPNTEPGNPYLAFEQPKPSLHIKYGNFYWVDKNTKRLYAREKAVVNNELKQDKAVAKTDGEQQPVRQVEMEVLNPKKSRAVSKNFKDSTNSLPNTPLEERLLEQEANDDSPPKRHVDTSRDSVDGQTSDHRREPENEIGRASCRERV